MQKTLSLNRRTHFFIKDAQFFIKLQRPNYRQSNGKDFYILKNLPLDKLVELRDWADVMIKEQQLNESN